MNYLIVKDFNKHCLRETNKFAGALARKQGTIFIKWESPPQYWHRLNTDGSSLGNPRCARGGGIIRNSNGEWVGGYARAIGIITSATTELWALQDGLKMCIGLNLLAVIIELDAKLVVDLLKNPGGSLNGNDVIVVDCKESHKKISRTLIKHCFREANKYADALARRGALLSQDFTSFSFPPFDIALLLSLDFVGTLYQRVCSNFFVFASA